jgi:protein SCO1
MKQTWSFITLIIALPVIAFALVSWYQKKFDVLPVLGPKDHVVKQFSGIDQNADSVNANTIKDKIAVVNLFFTHCPVVCPKMMKGIQRVQQNVNGVTFLSFSIDPERDSVIQLVKYSQQLKAGANWHFITGSKKDIYHFARKELLILATDGDGGENDFIHSDNLVLIDKQQRIRGYYKGTEESQVDLLINDINKLKNE